MTSQPPSMPRWLRSISAFASRERPDHQVTYRSAVASSMLPGESCFSNQARGPPSLRTCRASAGVTPYEKRPTRCRPCVESRGSPRKCAGVYAAAPAAPGSASAAEVPAVTPPRSVRRLGRAWGTEIMWGRSNAGAAAETMSLRDQPGRPQRSIMSVAMPRTGHVGPTNGHPGRVRGPTDHDQPASVRTSSHPDGRLSKSPALPAPAGRAPMTAWLLLAAALLLIVACGVFVAAEFAFVTVDRSRVDQAAAEGDHAARGLQQALRSLSTQLSGAQVGITVTNLAIGFLAEPAVADLIDGPLTAAGTPSGAVRPIAVGVGLILGTILTMIFGELVPKNLALARPMEVARATQRFQRGFTAVNRLPIRVLNGSANAAVR